MATLPEDASWWAKFKIGQYGWAHGAQEGGLWAVFVLLLGWLVSPLVGVGFMILMVVKGDQYWEDREIDQSLAMKRVPTQTDLKGVPKKPTKFWKLDAIHDVMFPRMLRKIWYAVSPLYLLYVYGQVGLNGYFF